MEGLAAAGGGGGLEPAEKIAVFTLGRFQPPTIGHKVLIEAVAFWHPPGYENDISIGRFVIPTKTEEKVPRVTKNEDYPKQNRYPLKFEDKLPLMEKMFSYLPQVEIINTLIEDAGNFFKAVPWIKKKGYKKVYLVLGKDRAEEALKGDLRGGIQQTAAENSVNGVFIPRKVFGADGVLVLERDPEAEGIEGMSATKLRTHAFRGEKSEFIEGMKTSEDVTEENIIPIYNKLRKRWGLQGGSRKKKRSTRSRRTQRRRT